MSYSREELLEIKDKLSEELFKTEESVIKYKALTKPISPENAIGRVSRMDAINNKSVNDSALRNAEIKLKNLQIALSRINESDFGLCRRCFQPIPVGRILLLPHAITCVNCASG